jgi:hypothetical protein
MVSSAIGENSVLKRQNQPEPEESTTEEKQPVDLDD